MKSRILGLALFTVSCQSSSITSSQQEILGGKLVQNPADFPTVVALVDDFGGLCTGTLIAPRVVLTAAHCIDPALFGVGSEAQIAQAMNVVFDSTDAFAPFVGGDGTIVGATKTVKNPSFRVNNLGDNDIGLIFLNSAVSDREPSPVELDTARNFVGDFVKQVGFGISDQEPQAGLEVVLEDKLISSCVALDAGSNNELICYDQTDGSGKCSGDSGGPSFDAEGKVVGVTSFGDQNCERFGADTRISGVSEKQFLQDTIAANAALACGEDGFCFDSLCGEDPDCGGEKEGRCSVSPNTQGSPALMSLFGFLLLLGFTRRTKKLLP